MTEEVKDQEQQTQITPPSEGKEEVKEDVVIIGGKPRPLRNYESEIKRKHQEEIERIKEEYSHYSQPQTQQPQVDVFAQWDTVAQQEIATTGRALPIQTIMNLANRIADNTYSNKVVTAQKADKTIRSFKRDMAKEPDFKEIESDFDELVDKLQPNLVNEATLDVCLSSVRGKRLPTKIAEIEKAAFERGKKEAEKDTTIIGPTDTTTTTTTKRDSQLSAIQQAELDEMNRENEIQWTPTDYVKALESKKARFKNAGAKNVPETLNQKIIL